MGNFGPFLPLSGPRYSENRIPHAFFCILEILGNFYTGFGPFPGPFWFLPPGNTPPKHTQKGPRELPRRLPAPPPGPPDLLEPLPDPSGRSFFPTQKLASEEPLGNRRG